MEFSEANKLVAVMIAAYPNYKPVDINLTAGVFQTMLREYTYEQANAALAAFIATDTKGFAPSVGQLIGKIHALFGAAELGEMEAWQMVRQAISNGGYGAEEEFAKLPPIVQRALGSAGQIRAWALDCDYNESVAASNFMRAYRNAAEREREVARMPKQIRQLAEDTAKRLEKRERAV